MGWVWPQVCDAVGDAEERVVDIQSVEDGISPVAPAQQAVLRVYQCIADGDAALGTAHPFVLCLYLARSLPPSGSDKHFNSAREDTKPRVYGGLRGAGAREGRDAQATGRISARLLVPKGQIGCLLGRGGQIIESMRRETGASIQILPSESLPLCAEVRDRPSCLCTGVFPIHSNISSEEFRHPEG
jgi:hypothetical protein